MERSVTVRYSRVASPESDFAGISSNPLEFSGFVRAPCGPLCSRRRTTGRQRATNIGRSCLVRLHGSLLVMPASSSVQFTVVKGEADRVPALLTGALRKSHLKNQILELGG